MTKVRSVIKNSVYLRPVRREHTHIEENRDAAVIKDKKVTEMEHKHTDKVVDAETSEEDYSIQCANVTVHFECSRPLLSTTSQLAFTQSPKYHIPLLETLQYVNSTKLHFNVPVHMADRGSGDIDLVYAIGFPTHEAACRWTAQCN
jgi:hypothetical protein